MARSCGLDALAAPPSFPRASGVGRAAVASCWCVLRWRQGLRAFARRACRLRSGGNFARVFALCVPPCRFAVGVLLPGGPQPKARANPRLWPTAPALRLLRLADGLFCAGGGGYGRSAAASSASKRVSARPQRLFSACQGVIGFFEPMCRVFSKVECVRCFLSRSCAGGAAPPKPVQRWRSSVSGWRVASSVGRLSPVGAASPGLLAFHALLQAGGARCWLISGAIGVLCLFALASVPASPAPGWVHAVVSWRGGIRPGVPVALALFPGAFSCAAAWARGAAAFVPPGGGWGPSSSRKGFRGCDVVKGGTRPATPPADAPDAADHIPRAGLRQ